jgi:hypothetical protein
MEERRKHPRIEVDDKIFYVGVDQNNNLIDQNIGSVLNVSQEGVLLETPFALDYEHLILFFSDYENKTAKVKGKIIHSHKNGSGCYKVGVNLLGSTNEKVDFIKRFIKNYHYKKKKG